MTGPNERALTRLQRIIRLAYEMNEDDQRQRQQAIYSHRVKAWGGALEEEARKLGIRRSAKVPPVGVDREILWVRSEQDAASIRKTYNADLEREIKRLFDANPRGDRNYYIKNLEQWHANRTEWKERQIALYSQKTARHYAQQRFAFMNGAYGTRYRFTGPAPVCDDCAEMFAMGVVEQPVVKESPTPLHPNCPHEWATVDFRTNVTLDELWMG